jgi:hypothetical protein
VGGVGGGRMADLVEPPGSLTKPPPAPPAPAAHAAPPAAILPRDGSPPVPVAKPPADQIPPKGQVEPGNINLHDRPKVLNEDGSISTVRSMSFEENGKEILVPTVSEDGRIMEDEEAIDQYHKTGRHLGKFSNPEDATAYAKKLHEDQATEYRSDLVPPDQGTQVASLTDVVASVAPRVIGKGDVPVVFSKVAKVIEGMQGDKFTQDQVLGVLKNTPGVKEAERSHLDLPRMFDQLKQAKGTDQVTKQELLDYVNQKTPTFETVDRAANWIRPDVPQSRMLEVRKDLYAEMDRIAKTDTDKWNRIPSYGRRTLMDNIKYLTNAYSTSSNLNPVVNEMNNILKKYGLEELDPGKFGFMKSNRLSREYEEYNVISQAFPGDLLGEAMKPRDYHEIRITTEGIKDISSFPGEHYPEDGILAHARVYSLAAPDGKKTLFVDELQSDTMQSLRAEGIDTPFSNNWPDLTMKFLTRYAAEQGYERISWNSAEKTSERWAEEETGVAKAAGLYKHLYDNVIPQFFKNTFKKDGAKVEKIEFKAGDEAREFLKNMPEGTGEDVADEAHLEATGDHGLSLGTFQSVDITPSMRDRVLKEGLPMFAAGGGAATLGMEATSTPGASGMATPGGPSAPNPVLGALQRYGDATSRGIQKALDAFNQSIGAAPLVRWLSERDPLPFKIDTSKESEGIGENLAEGTAQFLTGQAPLAAVAAPFEAAGLISATGKWMLSGMGSDAFFQSPDSGSLGDFLKSVGELSNAQLEGVRRAIVAATAKNESDGDLQKRLKNAVGGVITGEAFGALFALAKAAKGVARGMIAAPGLMAAGVAATGDQAGPPPARAGSDSFTGGDQQMASRFEMFKDAMGALRNSAMPTSPVARMRKVRVPKGPLVPSTIASVADYDAQKAAASAILPPLKAAERPATEKYVGDLLGVSQNRVRRALGSSSDQELTTTAVVLQHSVEHIDAFARQAVRDPTVDNLGKFVQGFMFHQAVKARELGDVGEADRLLAQWNGQPPSFPPGIGASLYWENMVKQFGGEDQARYVLQLFSSLQDGEAKSRFAGQTLAGATKDAVYTYFINSMLSSPSTAVTNIAGNSLFFGMQFPERAVAAMIPGGDTRLGEVPAMAIGMMHGLMDTFRLAHLYKNALVDPTQQGAYDTFRRDLGRLGFDDAYHKIEQMFTGQAISGAAFGQNGPLGTAIDYLGHVVGVPGRVLQVSDAMFKAMSYRAQLYALSYRDAMRVYADTGSQQRALDLLTDGVTNPSPELHDQAMDFARIATFTKELGQFGQAVDRARTTMPMLNYLVPFFRTPVNITKQTWYRTPLAPLFGQARADILAGGDRRQQALAKVMTGSAVMALGAFLSENGILTGSVSPDQKIMLQQKNLSGRQPFSIQLGDEWVSYDRLEPLSTLLGIASTTAETMRFVENADDADAIYTAAAGAIMNMLQNKTILNSFTDLTNLLGTSDPNEVKNFFERLTANRAGVFVPNVVNKLNQMMDPTVRVKDVDPNDPVEFQVWQRIVNEVRARTPGLSKGLPPMRDAFGNEVPTNVYSLLDVVSPLYQSKVVGSVLGDELLRLQMSIDRPDAAVKGVKLSPQQHDRMIEIKGKELVQNGQTFQEALEETVGSDAYQRLPSDQLKKDIIKNISASFNKAAQDTLLNEDADLLEAVQAKNASMMGATP